MKNKDYINKLLAEKREKLEKLLERKLRLREFLLSASEKVLPDKELSVFYKREADDLNLIGECLRVKIRAINKILF